jgi:uncharacterized protein (TIGR00645 family)
MSQTNPVEHAFESLIFASRWLMAPFYLGLILALIVLLVIFGHEILITAPTIFHLNERDVLVWVLSLIDMSLAANLLIMVIFSGYENFVSKIDTGDHPDRPSWMGKVDFSGMKLKLIASIVAISAIHLLKAFMEVGTMDKTNLKWLVVIHLTFVVSGVLLAFMDWISARIGHATSHA